MDWFGKSVVIPPIAEPYFHNGIPTHFTVEDCDKRQHCGKRRHFTCTKCGWKGARSFEQVWFHEEHCKSD